VNGNYFSGINGNGSEVSEFRSTGMGRSGNEIMGKGGNGMPKVIPAHL